MDVIIMAGGLAQRLNMGEKACVLILNNPLISYVISALKNSKYINKIFVSTTKNTPKTKKLIQLKYPEITIIDNNCGSYVLDMINSIKESKSKDPVMVIMCDLPLIKSEIIDKIIEEYYLQKKDALSTYVPLSICKKIGIIPDTIFKKNGTFIVPVGINILNPNKVDFEQEDFNYILEDERLALNINKKIDLNICVENMKKYSNI